MNFFRYLLHLLAIQKRKFHHSKSNGFAIETLEHRLSLDASETFSLYSVGMLGGQQSGYIRNYSYGGGYGGSNSPGGGGNYGNGGGVGGNYGNGGGYGGGNDSPGGGGVYGGSNSPGGGGNYGNGGGVGGNYGNGGGYGGGNDSPGGGGVYGGSNSPGGGGGYGGSNSPGGGGNYGNGGGVGGNYGTPVDDNDLEIIENDGDVTLGRDREGQFYANNHRLKFGGQSVKAKIAAWSLLGAETVGEENFALVKHESGIQHRWRLNSEWSFEDAFLSISNISSSRLPVRARETSDVINIAVVSGAYEINGVNNPTLVVRRGEIYTFNLNTQGHPLYLQTTGGGYQSWNTYFDGFTGNNQTRGKYQWVVPEDAPDEVFYQSKFHPTMFGKIIVVD